jgi:hypothetical protein
VRKCLVLFEPNDYEPRPPAGSKAYQRWMGVLFVLGVIGLILAVSYAVDL